MQITQIYRIEKANQLGPLSLIAVNHKPANQLTHTTIADGMKNATNTTLFKELGLRVDRPLKKNNQTTMLVSRESINKPS